MKISKEQVEHVANLARLTLSEEEKEELTKDMINILNFADKLGGLDTEGIDPTAHVMKLENVFREDIVKDEYSRAELLQNAPEKENGCFHVPKIVE